MKKISLVIVLLVVVAPILFYLGRSRHKTNLEYLFNMRHTWAYKAFSPNKFFKNGQTLQLPVEGTISRGYTVYDQTYDEAKTLNNPFTADEKTLARGQNKFETYCMPCHGIKGAGQGTVSPPFPTPPELVADNAKHLADGEIFHIMTHGRNLMPAYASQIESQDRWKIILYVRKLQQEPKP